MRFFRRRRQSELDLDAELRDHFEREVENNLRAGLSAEEARYAARRLIGPIALYKDECRDTHPSAFLENLLRDFRYAARSLRRTPLFTAAAILTLALGIGANTTVFTFIENLLLRSVPARDPAQLVAPDWGNTLNISYPNYLDLRNRNSTLASLTAYRQIAVSLGLAERNNLRVWGYEATGNYFQTLGIEPFLGRFFTTADDDKPGAHAVIVISYRLWQSRFAADPHILGRGVKVNGFQFTIIGVARPDFLGTELITTGDYWLPLSMQLQIEPDFNFMPFRLSQNLWTLGRMKPGITSAQAEADLNRIVHDLARAYPNEVSAKKSIHLSRPGLVGSDLRKPMTSIGLVLMTVAVLGLLLASINLAGMLLARASDRHREMAIRLALGASRLQLLRQLFAESLLLSAAGTLVGLALAYIVCDLLSSWTPAFGLPINTAIHPNGLVLRFAVLIGLATALLCGLTPGIQALRAGIVMSLKNEPASARLRRWSPRDLLVAAQIALSVVLVISSALVIRSLQHALSLNLGFNPDRAVAVSFDLRLARYDNAHSRRFDQALLEKVSRLSGIESAGIVNNLPLRAGGLDGEFLVRAGEPAPPPADRKVALVYNISPGYLRAAGTRLVSGRDIDDRDRDGSPRVGLINEESARLLFGKENPLGKRFRIKLDPADKGIEVVGVVETGKYLSLGEQPSPAVFLPIAQTGTNWTTVVARTHLPPAVATAMLRKAVLDLDSNLTVFGAGSLKDELSLPLLPARAVAIVLSVFGILAITLAATGLFALMAYAVSRRAREIGIRMALGAQPVQVLTSLFRRTLALCFVGILLGTIATLAASRLLSAVLYDVSPRNPATYLSSSLLLVVVAILAGCHPAARAVAIDPATTLRTD